MAFNNTYSNVMVDLKNSSNVMADIKNISEYEMEDVYENINTEISSTKSTKDSVLKRSTVTPKQYACRPCGKSFTITWGRIAIAIFLFAVVQSCVAVFVFKTILNNEMSKVDSTTYSEQTTSIKECGSPLPVEHSRHLMTGNGTGTLVMYACDEGYYLKGIPAVFCQTDGNWSKIQFLCFRDDEIEKIHEEIRKLNSSLKLYKKRQEQQHALGFQDFEFDKSTLYRYRFLSNDNRTISNYKITEDMKTGSGTQQKLQGVIGTRPFTKHDTVYYEIVVHYNLSQTMSKITLDFFAFELGFSTLYAIDNFFYSEPSSFKFVYSPTKNAIVADFQINKSLLCINNTIFGGIFSLYVNGPQREITCYQRHGDDLENLYTFRDVDFEKPLYPTFAIESKMTAKISLNLKTRTLIKTIPKQLYDSV